MSSTDSEATKSFKQSFRYHNDVRDISTDGVIDKIKENSRFSFSYIVLLSAATVVCTLGLLLNSTPIVIGGMLISPLMWPLMKISVGVSYERSSFIIQALYLLIFSILISLVCSVLVTAIVPLKVLTSEILSRTTPTLLDIFVAMAAGAIAAFSIFQKKISDSLAGVAIATSLMPPLCVAGIGLVLADFQVASGGFFLFFTNIISIIFISVFIFSVVGIKRRGDHEFRTKGIIGIIVVLLITSIPLLNSLQNYTFKLRAYQESKDIISTHLYEISPELVIRNISTGPDPDLKDTIVVNADIISPENIHLDYTQKAEIVKNLEQALDKKINLNLRIQKTISLQSEADINNGNSKKRISEYVENKVAEHDGQIILGNIESKLKDGKWQILVVLRAEPDVSFREAERQQMQDDLGGVLQAPVSLSINLVPILSLTDDSLELTDEIKKDVEAYFYSSTAMFEITDIIVSSESIDVTNDQNFTIKIKGQVTEDAKLENLELLKTYLTQKYEAEFRIELFTTSVEKVVVE